MADDDVEMYAAIKKINAQGLDTSDEVIKDFYDKYANAYEQSVYQKGYVVHRTITKVFHDLLGSGKEGIRILDAGCGTGIIGEHLRDYGYSNVDGLDISQEMLNIALKKGLYKKTYCAPLSKDHKLPILDGEYDSLICVGTITQNHVKAEAFDEIIRLVKPGGLIAFTIRHDAITDPSFGYVGKFDELVNEKKWKLVYDELTAYHDTDDAHINKCKILVYKVL